MKLGYFDADNISYLRLYSPVIFSRFILVKKNTHGYIIQLV